MRVLPKPRMNKQGCVFYQKMKRSFAMLRQEGCLFYLCRHQN
ncbi:MAG: hypothetical protein ACPGWR_10825 [Ardenticatenaceae bacterium]